ncbi:MAG: aldo/keto reductase [Chloroflexota bacterium]|nr:aldo/keto reductase [Chloroflexota bacterium]
MKKVILGQSGLLVSCLSMGSDTGIKPESGGRLLKRAFEMGVNLWDTDETYGTLPAVREALQQVDRSQVVLAAKTYGKDYHGARKSLENTLAALGADYLDVFHLHGVSGPGDFESRRDTLEALLEAKREGLIRAVGLSTHAVGMVEAAAEVQEIDVVLAILNRTGACIAGGGREEMEEALWRVYRAGKGVYLMKVLARGKLVGELEEALSYALRFPYAHSVCVGMKTVRELERNVSIARRIDRGS